MKNKKNKVIEKKIYKANTKLLKKIEIAMITVFLIAILAVPVKNGIYYLYLNSWTWHEVNDYNIKFKLPRAYIDLQENNNNVSRIASSLIYTDTSVKVNENYDTTAPEIVYSGGNILNGISMMVQCYNTERTTKTLDDIADSQHVLIRINYEDDYKIGEPEKEYVRILETDAIRTSTTLTNKNGTKKMINYLIPLEDKEITITFLGKQSSVEEAESQISKIVNGFTLLLSH